MTATEAYAFMALTFVLGGLVGSAATWRLIAHEIRALRLDMADLWRDNPVSQGVNRDQ